MLITDIFADNLDKISFFEEYPTVAIAISGGSDSTALLILAQKYFEAMNGKVIAMIVNHRLRKSALEEIAQVQNLCKKLQIEYYTLNIKDEDLIQNNIQANARKLRYSLIYDKCKELDILHLMTGHTKNDYAENFLIRTTRGSGLLGLTRQVIRYEDQLRMIRPLYNIHKATLKDYLNNNQITWIEDPTNDNYIFLRNEIRTYIESLNSRVPIYDRISTVQENLDIDFDFLQRYIIQAMYQHVRVYHLGFVIIEDIDKFLSIQETITSKIISYLVTIIGGKNNHPRHKSIKLFYQQIKAQRTITLHSTMMSIIDNKLYIYKEYISCVFLYQLNNNQMLWDNRFMIQNINLNNYHIGNIENEVIIKQNDLYVDIISSIQQDYDFIPHKILKRIYHTIPVVIAKSSFQKRKYFLPSIDEVHLKTVSIMFKPVFSSRIFHYSNYKG